MPQDDTTITTDNNMTTGQPPADGASVTVPVDANGVPVDTNGMPVDANGMPVDVNGTPADYNAVPVNTDGTPVDTNGIPVDANGVPIDTAQYAANSDVASPADGLNPEQAIQAIDPSLPFYSDTIVTPGSGPKEKEKAVKLSDRDVPTEIATKLSESKNVLIALSSDPSVDELSAAIGLSLYLDRIGKRATAIYSGTTPNALEFLKPEETFEASADTLQDFVIAINKDKADHLRYKLDGDYVKVYITPYKHRLSEADLEFSYGDYNVDFVISLDVANGIDLDSALREHGRIMHDASIVNVTTGNPGKFGEIEWSDKKASSVSEMLAELLYRFGGEDPIAKDEATAFLTGVVAATNRFSNTKTTPETMRLCSKLMESGANQVLVSKNVKLDTENEIFNAPLGKSEKNEVENASVDATESKEASDDAVETKEQDATKLDIKHEGAQAVIDDEKKDDASESENADKNVENKVEENETEEVNADLTKKEHTLLDDLKEAEESLSHTGAETTELNDENKLNIENGHITSTEVSGEPKEKQAKEESTIEQSESVVRNDKNDKDDTKVIEPAADFNPSDNLSEADKYGEMLKTALDNAPESAEPTGAIMSAPDEGENPVAASVPDVPTAPDINGVPEMNYTQSTEDVLPPPPAPPVDDMAFGVPPVVGDGPNAPDESVMPPMPADDLTTSADASVSATGANDSVQPIPLAIPTTEAEVVPVGEQPAMQDQIYSAPQNDPGAFQIPGAS